jgi:hypothetical protein
VVSYVGEQYPPLQSASVRQSPGRHWFTSIPSVDAQWHASVELQSALEKHWSYVQTGPICEYSQRPFFPCVQSASTLQQFVQAPASRFPVTPGFRVVRQDGADGTWFIGTAPGFGCVVVEPSAT